MIAGSAGGRAAGWPPGWAACALHPQLEGLAGSVQVCLDGVPLGLLGLICGIFSRLILVGALLVGCGVGELDASTDVVVVVAPNLVRDPLSAPVSSPTPRTGSRPLQTPWRPECRAEPRSR